MKNMQKSATTRACVFATLHRPATVLLMDMLEQSGLSTFVGKVNMDRNAPDYLVEETKKSTEETLKWIEETIQKTTVVHIRSLRRDLFRRVPMRL